MAVPTDYIRPGGSANYTRGGNASPAQRDPNTGLTPSPMAFNPASGGYVGVRPPTGYQWDPVVGGWVNTPTTPSGQATGTAGAAGVPGVGSIPGQSVPNYGQQQADQASQQLRRGNQQISGEEQRQARAGQAWGIQQGLINSLENAFSNQQAGLRFGGSFGEAQVPPPTFTPSAAIDTAATAAQNSAFGRAKATAGSLGRSAVESLRSELASRGIAGGGTEGRGIMAKLAEATNPLSDINAQALHENVGIAQRNQELGQQANLTGYQGGITQRGQDLQAQEALASLNTQRRQQQLEGLIAAMNNLGRMF